MSALNKLAEVGLKAITYLNAVESTKRIKGDYHDALNRWRDENGYWRESIQAGSPEWNTMLGSADAQYLALKQAKRTEKNARDRLFRAARKVQPFTGTTP